MCAVMSSSGGDNVGNKPTKMHSLVDDDSDSETQCFDSHTSSPAFSGGEVEVGNGGESLQDTMPLDNYLTFEDAFETQVLDLADETQVLDFGGETQDVNLCGETQDVNLCGETQALDDVNWGEYMDTQLLDVFDDLEVRKSDGEETDSTEVLGDNDDVFVKENGAQSVDKGKGQCSSVSNYSEKEPIEQPKASCNEHSNSGSWSMRFTSIRAASLRASGMAARYSLKGPPSFSPSIPNGDPSLKNDVPDNAIFTMKSGNNGHLEQDLGRSSEVVNGSSMCRAGNLTARKLFTENLDCENEDLPCDTSIADGEDLVQAPACDQAGLSYVESQEPGELSQANALDFVDRFLKENDEEFDKEVYHGNSIGGKSKLVSSVKGPQMLAKKANFKSMVDEFNIYDWDDNREDEGGGDILCRRKEDFFGRGSLGRRPLKSRVIRSEEQKDTKKLLNGNNKRMDGCNSDSKLISHNLNFDDKSLFDSERTFKRNLINELDEQSNVDFKDKQVENNATKTDVPEMFDVGVDTQMAVEAMEALFCGEDNANFDINDDCQGVKNSISCRAQKRSSRKRSYVNDAGFATKQLKKTKSIGADISNVSSLSSAKQYKNVRKLSKTEPSIKKLKRAKENEKLLNSNRSKNMQEKVLSSGPIAHRTRRSMGASNHDENVEKESFERRGEINILTEAVAADEKSNKARGLQTSKGLTLGNAQCSKIESSKPNLHEEFANMASFTNENKIGAISFPKARRSSRILSRQINNTDNADDLPVPSVQPEVLQTANGSGHTTLDDFANVGAITSSNKIGALSFPKARRSIRISSLQVNNTDNVADAPVPSVQSEVLQISTGSGHTRSRRQTRSSICGHPLMSSVEHDAEGKLPQKRLQVFCSNAESDERDARLAETPREKLKPSDSSCITPLNCKIPISDVSPICMGNEYIDKSSKTSLSRPSLLKEIRSLSAAGPQATSVSKVLRKRREINDVRVLYSHHLDDDIIKQQKKILARLGVSVASSITDATHFIADQFVRTRNMLEAIAFGKPVVTSLWIDSCGQAKCFLDEKKYILRDSKKEKEIGFSMPASLACAAQHPILQGLRVLVTPNTKPGVEIISNLVKAVQGQAVERIGRSAMKDGAFPDDLLVLSCEEDYAICVPFLEKGATIYSSELLLNGIVTQKLEYERYRLFTDHVKKTRSTLWLRKEGSKFLPVNKTKASSMLFF
ncbi:uncharacterized protein LOC133819360 [Humulus lupulus]|uniref:uncharacterized protein LOC133819360 n=1 Tax=Humulus lupulus TaxID=3486 RepID=UPI002B414C02|nr:uncharacterized protein LOC133819360 [Humulus lupulus]XP_062108568.1 uncharacterized protein LOC133819360 [Humulus lupulus]